MANASPRRTSSWVGFLAGVVATLAVVLAWWALSAGHQAADEVKIVTPLLSELPVPRLPDALRFPDAPVPAPR